VNELARRGRHLFEQTYEQMPTLKARLHCSSCHLQGGTAAGAAALASIAVGPQELATSVNDCLENSMNGQAIASDSMEMKAFLAYLQGLKADPAPARGVRALQRPDQEPDERRGGALYAEHCAACHKADGSGTYKGSTYVYPAVWGESSFTSAARMASTDKLAGFVFVKMPLGQGKTLTVQEAWDIAAYVARQPRPKNSQDNSAGR
jgi:thiosulfate dehydrogenase